MHIRDPRTNYAKKMTVNFVTIRRILLYFLTNKAQKSTWKDLMNAMGFLIITTPIDKA